MKITKKQFKKLNHERCDLIQKRLDSGLTPFEESRLGELNKMADEYIEENFPFDLSYIDALARKFGIELPRNEK